VTDLTEVSGERRPETRVEARGGYPGKVQGNQRNPYLEVHFFPDGSIKAALSDYPAPPRMQLERFSYVKRRPSGNVDNDERFGSCGHDH
jgi:hypothetical protein